MYNISLESTLNWLSKDTGTFEVDVGVCEKLAKCNTHFALYVR